MRATLNSRAIIRSIGPGQFAFADADSKKRTMASRSSCAIPGLSMSIMLPSLRATTAGHSCCVCREGEGSTGHCVQVSLKTPRSAGLSTASSSGLASIFLTWQRNRQPSRDAAHTQSREHAPHGLKTTAAASSSRKAPCRGASGSRPASTRSGAWVRRRNCPCRSRPCGRRSR